MTKETIRKIASNVAAALLTNGDGEKATRLVLMQKEHPFDAERDLGGLCRSALVDRIAEELSRHLSRVGRASFAAARASKKAS